MRAMKTPPAVLLWVALALMAYAGTAWAWDRLQLPNPLRIVDLITSGDVTVGDDLVVTDDATVATLTFSGGGTPCLTRGGNTVVQTCTGDGFVDLGTFQVQGTSSDFWDSIKNTVTGASCSGNTGAVCVNDAQGLAVANGSGTTVFTVAAATGNAVANGQGLLSVHNAVTGPSVEYGEQALTAGTATITFGTAFSATPTCLCGDTSNTTETACSTTAESTTQVVLNGTTTGTYTWICLGAR